MGLGIILAVRVDFRGPDMKPKCVSLLSLKRKLQLYGDFALGVCRG